MGRPTPPAAVQPRFFTVRRFCTVCGCSNFNSSCARCVRAASLVGGQRHVTKVTESWTSRTISRGAFEVDLRVKLVVS